MLLKSLRYSRISLLSLDTGREAFKSSKVLVVGVSADPVEKQKEFVEKQKLTVRIAGATVLIT